MRSPLSTSLIYFCLEERLLGKKVIPSPGSGGMASVNVSPFGLLDTRLLIFHSRVLDRQPLLSSDIYECLSLLYAPPSTTTIPPFESKFYKVGLRGWKISKATTKHRNRKYFEGNERALHLFDSNKFVKSFPDVLIAVHDDAPGNFLKIYMKSTV